MAIGNKGVFIEKRHEKQIEILNRFNEGADKIVVGAGVRSGENQRLLLI